MDIILKVEHLKKYFAVNVGGPYARHMASLKAVDDVSFEVGRGETVGLVGETGCGKTTVGRTIVSLYKPTAGTITYCDENLCVMTGEAMRKVRSKLQMIFQDPYASLNPRMTVGNIIEEPMDIFSIGTMAERRERVQEPVSYTHLRAHETRHDLVCRLLLEKKKTKRNEKKRQK